MEVYFYLIKGECMAIHKFFLNDKYILMDVNGGSIHIVDELTYRMVDHCEDKSLQQVYALFPEDAPELVAEIYGELQDLKEQGYLYTPDIKQEQIRYNPGNVIKALCLHVAHDCDLRCKYCFASQGDYGGQRRLMSLETGKAALDFLVAYSGNRRNLEVDFFGGEPLLNFEVVKELTLYGEELNRQYDKNIRFTITTNGVSLDEDKIDFINEHMVNVVMSLDGRKEINDEMRPTVNGKGSYDLVVKNFKRLIEKRGDKEHYIRGTFTANNLDFMQDAMDYYDQGFRKISIEPVVTDPKESYALREEHLERILQEYEDFSRAYMEINRGEDKMLFFHFRIDLAEGPCLAKRSVGCGAGSEYIAVTYSGEIYPCHQFVGDERFKIGDLWEGITDLDLRDTFKGTNVFTKEECSSCWAKFYCSGGCHANAFYNNGTILRPYQLGCEMEKKRLECAISILANEEV